MEPRTYTVPISKLIGLDIDGLKAIVTQPQYAYQYPQGRHVVTLRRIRIYRELYKGTSGPRQWFKWLRIEFDPLPQFGGCGFSGWREDRFNEQQPVIELLYA